MYDVNGLPPTVTSTRRSASRTVICTAFEACAACAHAANGTAWTATAAMVTRANRNTGPETRGCMLVLAVRLRTLWGPRASASRGRGHAGEHAPHVSERLL